MFFRIVERTPIFNISQTIRHESGILLDNELKCGIDYIIPLVVLEQGP